MKTCDIRRPKKEIESLLTLPVSFPEPELALRL